MRVVVVGGGIIGLASAYELLADGHEVTVVETDAPAAGASLGNAAKIAVAEATPVPAPGMVVQGLRWMLRSDSPLYVKPSLSPPFLRFMLTMARNCTQARYREGLDLLLGLAADANDDLDRWQQEGLSFEMHERGVLLGWEDRQSFEERLRYQEQYSAWGSEPEVLDAAGVQRVEPTLSDQVQHGLYFPRDRQVGPASLAGALVSGITARGGQILSGTSVTGFQRAGERVTGVRIAGGELLPADAVVIAAGVWTSALCAQLGARVPIQPGKGYSIDLPVEALPLRTSLTLEGPHIAATPLDGLVRIAGTMEFSGMSTKVNPTRVAAIIKAAARSFRDWPEQPEHTAPWAGLRPMTADGLPVVGRLAPGANVLVASGHGMLGLTLAPRTGRTIADLMAARVAEDPRTSPARFG